jgi:hypothetical protein
MECVRVGGCDGWSLKKGVDEGWEWNARDVDECVGER